MNNLQLPKWLEHIDSSKVLDVLVKAQKPLTSMEVFGKLKEKGYITEKDFASFSKLFCSILPKIGIIKILPTVGTKLYIICPKENY